MSNNETPQDVTPTDTELVRAVQAQPPDAAQRARAYNEAARKLHGEFARLNKVKQNNSTTTKG